MSKQQATLLPVALTLLPKTATIVCRSAGAAGGRYIIIILFILFAHMSYHAVT